MRIDPLLQSFIGPHIATVRATIGHTDEQERQIIKPILYTLVGMGLAQAVDKDDDGISWVPTRKFKRRRNVEVAPIGFSVIAPLLAVNVDPNRQSMTGSLRLIIDDMVKVSKDAGNECASSDSTLAALGGFGYALLGEGPNGDLVWTACPELISSYVLGMEWRLPLPGEDLPLIRRDDTLKREIDRFWNLSREKFGAAEEKRSFTCSWLLRLERRGDAIAYKNNIGQMAWKASPEFVKKLSAEDAGVVDGEKMV